MKGDFADIAVFSIMFIVILGIVLIFYELFFIYPDQQKTQEQLCKDSCTFYNATFVDWQDSFYENEECWCRKDIYPIQVW